MCEELDRHIEEVIFNAWINCLLYGNTRAPVEEYYHQRKPPPVPHNYEEARTILEDALETRMAKGNYFKPLPGLEEETNG